MQSVHCWGLIAMQLQRLLGLRFDPWQWVFQGLKPIHIHVDQAGHGQVFDAAASH